MYNLSTGKDVYLVTVYLVTELLGQELDDRKAQCGVVSERMAIDKSRTVLQSIDFCVSRGVVHRDIKLQNVLFRINGNFRTLQLVDFGLARVLQRGRERFLRIDRIYRPRGICPQILPI
jgi:serine/threonine protein kinase